MKENEGERAVFLFVLWEAARDVEAAVLADMSARFRILKQFEVMWSQAEWETHLRTFYGLVSPVWAVKRLRNGSGAFRVVMVEDSSPVYDLRANMRGQLEKVDVNVWEAKRRYRKQAGVKDAVHSSVNLRETRQNFAMLTGVPLAEFLARTDLDGAVEALSAPPVTERGWRDVWQFFRIMNECTPYVVLRNAQDIGADAASGLHGDIDLLVGNLNEFSAFAGAVKVKSKSWHSAYVVNIANRPVKLDLRVPGDGYYDEAWERDMLERRVLRDGLYVQGDGNDLTSLLYHALVHKETVSADYRERFGDIEALKGRLLERMRKDGYAVTRPVDDKVGFHPEHLGGGLPVKTVGRGLKPYADCALTAKHLKIHLFPACGLPNLLRVQIRLGGAFKIDFCVGVVRDFVIM